MTAIDTTVRESNILDSIKKYFFDSLTTIEGIAVSFDKTLIPPKVQGIEVDKWYAIILGQIRLGTLSEVDVDIFCCTKKDPEGFKLAQLRDKVMGYIIDTTKTDCKARLILYKSSATEAWANIGTMVLQIESETPKIEADDQTKFKVITITGKWGALC
jgi:hypothetical protein